MNTSTELSVIIPTFKRTRSVRRTLESLVDQSLSAAKYEVVVVDDGSPSPPDDLPGIDWPFKFHYFGIANGGATQARNHGVDHSSGQVIVFIDDDVTVSRPTLESLLAAVREARNRLATGVLVERAESPRSVFARINSAFDHHQNVDQLAVLPFTQCNTQLLAVNRTDYFALGKLSDPTGGWPNWDDVAFGYRAHQAGFDLVRCPGAVGVHWDHALKDLATASVRWEKAARSAARLFSCYPELKHYLPMFRDKLPVKLKEDSPSLILRKSIRQLASGGAILGILQTTARLLEATLASPRMLRPIYRWTIGGYIYRGYWQGLRDLRRK